MVVVTMQGSQPLIREIESLEAGMVLGFLPLETRNSAKKMGLNWV